MKRDPEIGVKTEESEWTGLRVGVMWREGILC